MPFQLLGANRVQRSFQKKIDRLENPTKIFKVIGEMGRKDVNDHFEKEMGPVQKWKDLAQQRKKRQGQGKGRDKILQDTGRLRTSIRKRAFPEKVEVFTKVKYAPYHNFGTHTLAVRKFMYLSKSARVLMAKVFARFVMRGK